MSALIELRNLRKVYSQNPIPALDDVNLALEQGQIVGLLGPNGSGKTTLIKILNGLLRDYQGEVLIDGHRPDPYTKSIVSYLPDTTYLADYMRVKDAIDLFIDMYLDFDSLTMYEILKKFRIDPKSKIKTLSKGNKEKVQLALVLSRRAKIYVLDEPIGGVDPAAREFIIHTLLNNYNKGAILIISTHLVDEIEQICDTIVFLKEGHIVRFGKRSEIIETTGKTINELFKEDFKCF